MRSLSGRPQRLGRASDPRREAGGGPLRGALEPGAAVRRQRRAPRDAPRQVRVPQRQPADVRCGAGACASMPFPAEFLSTCGLVHVPLCSVRSPRRAFSPRRSRSRCGPHSEAEARARRRLLRLPGGPRAALPAGHRDGHLRPHRRRRGHMDLLEQGRLVLRGGARAPRVRPGLPRALPRVHGRLRRPRRPVRLPPRCVAAGAAPPPLTHRATRLSCDRGGGESCR